MPPVASMIEESLALERAGNIAAGLTRVREALDLARTEGEAEAIASALVCVARFHQRRGTALHQQENVADPSAADVKRCATDHAPRF